MWENDSTVGNVVLVQCTKGESYLLHRHKLLVTVKRRLAHLFPEMFQSFLFIHPIEQCPGCFRKQDDQRGGHLRYKHSDSCLHLYVPVCGPT